MAVHTIDALAKTAATPIQGKHSQAKPGFGDMLAQAIEKVSQQELEAESLGLAMAAGQVADFHTVTIAAQKAELALDLTLAVRNKVLDAYQEIMRMQV